VINRRRDEALVKGAKGSGTARALADPELLRAKLLEEAGELSEAADPQSATHEAADLIYFALVAAARHGVGLEDIRRELEARHLRVRRRPMTAKEEGRTQ
jgi:phosphoribosyl-ATP pyrophosphohydrolase